MNVTVNNIANVLEILNTDHSDNYSESTRKIENRYITTSNSTWNNIHNFKINIELFKDQGMWPVDLNAF